MNLGNCLYNGPKGDVATLNCLPFLFRDIVGTLLTFAGAVALFLIIFSGIKFITSGGDAKQVEGARKTLTYAVLGLVVILLAAFVVNIVSDITNVPCIRTFGFGNCK
ncbi:MAG TPA: pilin [Patescibacteria group bacterium]|nr:pilin [Patescibacteria group bacterium]